MHVSSRSNQHERRSVVEAVHARVVAGVVQRRLAEPVTGLEICRPRHQQADGVDLAGLHRQVQRCCPCASWSVNEGAEFDELSSERNKEGGGLQGEVYESFGTEEGEYRCNVLLFVLQNARPPKEHLYKVMRGNGLVAV